MVRELAYGALVSAVRSNGWRPAGRAPCLCLSTRLSTPGPVRDGDRVPWCSVVYRSFGSLLTPGPFTFPSWLCIDLCFYVLSSEVQCSPIGATHRPRVRTHWLHPRSGRGHGRVRQRCLRSHDGHLHMEEPQGGVGRLEGADDREDTPFWPVFSTIREPRKIS